MHVGPLNLASVCVCVAQFDASCTVSRGHLLQKPSHCLPFIDPKKGPKEGNDEGKSQDPQFVVEKTWGQHRRDFPKQQLDGT